MFLSADGSNHTNNDRMYLVIVLRRKQWSKPAEMAGTVLMVVLTSSMARTPLQALTPFWEELGSF